MLAAKTVLAIRYDAFGEDSSSAMGVENRAKLEARLRALEDRGVRVMLCMLEKCYLSQINKPQLMYIFISPADQFYSMIHFRMSNIDTFYFCLLLTVSLVCDCGLVVN